MSKRVTVGQMAEVARLLADHPDGRELAQGIIGGQRVILNLARNRAPDQVELRSPAAQAAMLLRHPALCAMDGGFVEYWCNFWQRMPEGILGLAVIPKWWKTTVFNKDQQGTWSGALGSLIGGPDGRCQPELICWGSWTSGDSPLWIDPKITIRAETARHYLALDADINRGDLKGDFLVFAITLLPYDPKRDYYGERSFPLCAFAVGSLLLTCGDLFPHPHKGDRLNLYCPGTVIGENPDHVFKWVLMHHEDRIPIWHHLEGSRNMHVLGNSWVVVAHRLP